MSKEKEGEGEHWNSNRKNLERVMRFYNKHKLDHYIVYQLPNYIREGELPYVGKTSHPKARMAKHRYKGRDTSDWFILAECETNREALDIEASYHDLGHGGRQQRYIFKHPVNVGSGCVMYMNYSNRWVATQRLDKKTISVKTSKDKQVVIDALQAWNEEHGRDPWVEK